MEKAKKIFKSKIFLGVLAFAILAAGYSCKSYKKQKENPNDRTMPSFSQMVDGVKKAVEADERTGERWLVVDATATLKRLCLGLALGIVLAIFMGLIMGCFKICEGILMPVSSFSTKIIPTAASPVFLLLFGADIEMYVAMIAFGITGTLAISIYFSVRDVSVENLDKAATLGASKIDIIWTVIFKQILPKLIDSIRLTIGPALVFLMAAENYNASIGMGARIRILKRAADMSVVYPYLIFLAAFFLFADCFLKFVTSKMCPWYKKNE